MDGYDIIGDIHGHSERLIALLGKMGYSKRWGAWLHPSRKAIFVGDFIDRGPNQLEAIEIPRRMVGEGAALAILGNHELNAVCWAMPDPGNDNEFLRKHNAKNLGQHRAFLDAVENGSNRHRECVAWFRTLPVLLEYPEFRVIHAAWHDESVDYLRARLNPDGTLTESLLVESVRKGSATFDAVETVVKGPEVPLPEGYEFRDADGNIRRKIRLRWWESREMTWREAALLPASEAAKLPATPLPPSSCLYDDRKPVFFGHYWLAGQPRILTEYVACVDYSVAKGGVLCAYRWDGEDRLKNQHLTCR